MGGSSLGIFCEINLYLYLGERLIKALKHLTSIVVSEAMKPE